LSHYHKGFIIFDKNTIVIEDTKTMTTSPKLTGILVPMPEEIELILAHMTVQDTYTAGQRTFYLGTIQGNNCVVSLSRIGKVASSVTAAVMIEHFHINRLIVTGVAGGISNEVNIGDIVIATSCIQHDMDCSPIFPALEIPLLDKTSFECAAEMIESAHESCSHFIAKELDQYISEQNLNALGIRSPQVRRGVLVSGDQFIGTTTQLEAIKSKVPAAYFVEMEGAAVAQVCYEYNVPFVVVRSISDKADDIAHIDFNNYIKLLARYYTWGLIEGMMKKI
jgi:adenosylhomocysteine nucleosidase